MMKQRQAHVNEFGQLYKKNYSKMYFRSLAIVEDEEVARDIVGEVFSKLWANYETYSGKNMSGLLSVAVHNASIDFLRSKKYQHLDIDILNVDIETLEWDAEREERLQSLEHEIAQMPQLTKDILHQFYYQHRCQSDVAESLGVSPRVVKRHLYNALKKLREKLKIDKT